MLGNECASVSAFSLEMSLMGEVVGGDCASVLSVLLEEMDGEQGILLQSIFTGLDLVVLG